MKKLIRFLMATVLCVGMSTVVMATESEDTGNAKPEYSDVVAEATTVIAGQPVELISNQLTTEYNAEELLVLMDAATNVFDPEECKLTILGKPADYTLPAGYEIPVPDGLTLTFKFTDNDGNPVLLEAGKYYYIIHEKVEGQGDVEVFYAPANADGSITIEAVRSLSPFYVGTLEDITTGGGTGAGGGTGIGGGTGSGQTNAGNNNDTYYYDNEKASPKTADASYVIVMMAVVALAGVVVATRKVNVNR